MELNGLPAVSQPLPWHEQLWSRLSGQLARGQLPHALLLAGSQYGGKSRLALALARLLLCQQPSGGSNCGHCHGCELSAAGNHGDFRWLQPEEKSRVIKIDQIRAAVEFANKTAGFGQYKVMVLAPADCMNANAANALLKSLEEPAAGTYLILVCHRLHGVPATIRSRCQLVKMALPDPEQCLQWLDQLTGEREQSEKLLALADGRPLLAEQLYRDEGADHLAGVRLGMRGLLSGAVQVPQVAQLLKEASVEQFLAQLAAELQWLLRGLGREQLVSPLGRSAFTLLDEIGGIQRATAAGANPNRDLLIDSVLAKFQRELGDGRLGDTIHLHGGGFAHE